MTNYSFRPANRSEAKPLIGFYSESFGGKTKSALLLAKGFADDMAKVGMIETESGRGVVSDYNWIGRGGPGDVVCPKARRENHVSPGRDSKANRNR